MKMRQKLGKEKKLLFYSLMIYPEICKIKLTKDKQKKR